MNTSTQKFLFMMKLVGKPFWVSECRRHAWKLLLGIFSLLAALSAVNVLNNWVAGRFMTALAEKDTGTFYFLLMIYLLVLVTVVPLTVYYQMLRSRLGLSWRAWFTAHLIDRYFSNKAYLALSKDLSVDNPDNRICQDVDTFCNMSIGLFVAFLEASITVCSFAGVLWTISPRLMLIVIVYSIVGVAAISFIGKQLVGTNFEQVRLEANLKFSLSESRRNVDSLALNPEAELKQKHEALKALSAAVQNQELLINIYRNLGLFTSGYNQLVLIIPTAVAAAFFFTGAMEFGDLTRASMAFSQVFTGMTLIVQQFGAFSTYFASIKRLGSFVEALDAVSSASRAMTEI